VNLAEIIEQHPADNVALISRGRPTTYGELRRQVASLRGVLAENGVERGDRVAILCGNSRYFVLAYLATLGVGGIAVPLNIMSPATEIQRELDTIQPRMVFVEPAAMTAWSNIDRSSLTELRAVVATEGHDIAGAITLTESLMHAPVPILNMSPNEVAAFISPKAAMLTHNNLHSNLVQLSAENVLHSSDVVYGVLPLFHIFGLNVVLGYTLFTGASVVLVQRFDPSTALETFAERGVTVVPGAPQVWSALAQMPKSECAVLSKLRVALTGAAKMPEHVTLQLKEEYGLVVHEGYGLTESSPVVTTSVNGRHKVGSIGKPLRGVSIRLVDEHGDDAEEGDSGEIWVHGENVFAGYYNDQEATDRVITADGWLRTGDIAVRDADSDLFLVDRMKDLIIVSGFNVYPAEVEQVLLTHSAIEQAAVVGVSHPHSGEAVRAYVVLHKGVHLDEESIIEHCQKQLARYKCPFSHCQLAARARYCVARCVDFARVELLATRNPKNKIDTPISNVTANARS
jgi:long-chain acyl-CoA synthetase